MNKSIKLSLMMIVLFLSTLVLFSFHTTNNNMEEMVILNPEKYFSKYSEGYTELFMLNKPYVTSVLIYYEINTMYDINRKILIPKTVSEDTNFVINILEKAQDSMWVKRHIFLSPDSTRYAY